MENQIPSLTVVYTTFKRTSVLIESVQAVLREYPFVPIYIYSDHWGHGKSDQRDAILLHRKKISACFNDYPNVLIVCRPQNYGMYNAIDAVHEHLRHGPVFFLEDDIVPVAGFSFFLNANYTRFYSDHSVTCLSLFNPLSSRVDCPAPIQLTRTSMYGTLFWNHKIRVTDRLRQSEISHLSSDSFLQTKIVSLLSPDGFNYSLLDYYCQSFNALDCRFTFRQALTGSHGIVPHCNMVHNYGLNGDGHNCPDSIELRNLFLTKDIIASDLEALQAPPSPYSYEYDCLAGHTSALPSDFDTAIYDNIDVWNTCLDWHLRSKWNFYVSQAINYLSRLRAALP